MIHARALTRSFPGGVEAVRGIDLDVAAGSSLALVGPNGAGKSTTIAMLTTLLRPDSGSATINGFDVLRERRAVRSSIGIVFQDPTLDIHLTVAENLRFHAELYDIPRAQVAARIAGVSETFGIHDRLPSLVRTLSGGLRRRVELARALLHEPRVLFLDEPTLGLDPYARAELRAELARLRAQAGTTTVVTTHDLAEAAAAAQVAIMDAGRIVASGTPEQLTAAHGGGTLEDVFRAVTGRSIDVATGSSARAQGRETDRQRSGPR